jgi:membrane protease YdiL (CAAX protease family)
MLAGDQQEYPFWSYEDLALFLGSVLPSFGLAALIVRLSRISGDAPKTLLYQSLTYVLLLGVMYLLIAGRYHRPFWRSLGWMEAYQGAWLCVVAGPVLAVVTVVLGLALRAPQVPSQVESLISDQKSLEIVGLFITILGPIFEELTFRGFLLPLLARSLGAWPGILLTAVPFALMHGTQYHWAWQHLAVIGVTGVAFGYARFKTQSTFAAAMVHASYNTTLFAGYLFQRSVYNP